MVQLLENTGLTKYIFPDSPVLRQSPSGSSRPLHNDGRSLKLYGVPQPIGDVVSQKLNTDIAIFFVSSHHTHASPSAHSFAGPSLDSAKWNSGAAWKLIGVSSPTKHDTLLVTGTDIGFMRVLNHFESYYDIRLSFQIPIINPMREKSITWLVRLEHSWRGDSILSLCSYVSNFG